MIKNDSSDENKNIQTSKISPVHSFLLYPNYYLIGLFLIGIISFYISHVTLIYLDPNSARYILSSIIQSQAAIISIVVTLTLVAVQITASTYSSRVIDVFKQHSRMWFLVCFYILSISLTTLLLFLITGNETLNSKSVLFGVLFASGFFIFLLVVLIPYIQDSLEFLKAENILKLLSKIIDKPNIDQGIDPFQSIFDIIYGAINNFDFTTMNIGLTIAQKKYDELITDNENEESKKYLSQKFFDNFQRAAILLMKNGESENANKIVNYLEGNFIFYLKNDEIAVLSEINSSNQKIGKYAADNRFNNVVNRSIILSINIGEEITKIEDKTRLKKLDIVLYDLIVSLGEIALVALEKHIEHDSFKSGVESIERFCIFASDKDMIFQPTRQTYVLTSLADLDITQNIGYIVRRIIIAIQNICLRNIKNKQEKAAFSAIDDLFLLAVKSRNPDQIRYARSIKDGLFRIAVEADDLENKNVRNKALESMVQIKQSFYAEFEKETLPNVFDFESNSNYGLSLLEEELRDQVIYASKQLADFQKERKEMRKSSNMK